MRPDTNPTMSNFSPESCIAKMSVLLWKYHWVIPWNISECPTIRKTLTLLHGVMHKQFFTMKLKIFNSGVTMSKSGILYGTETLQNANEANTNCVFSQLVKLPVFTVTSSLLLSSLGFYYKPPTKRWNSSQTGTQWSVWTCFALQA